MGVQMTDALAYLRVSGTGQVDGDGFPRQREKIQNYAALHGYNIIGEYTDDESGTNECDSREGFAAMLDRMENNGCKIVLVEGAHRFARDLVVQELMILELIKAGVTVIEIEGGNDLTDDSPTKTFIRQVLGAYAQLDKSLTVLKLRAARERKRRQNGKCEGAKAYEETGDPEVVERIKREMGRGSPSRAVARRLNEDGIPGPKGGKWSHSSICGIWKRLNKRRNQGVTDAAPSPARPATPGPAEVPVAPE